MTVHRNALIALVAQKRLPAIYSWSFFARDGGLISYGIDAPYLFKQASGYVDQILKGTKTENMPIQQPSKFELLINMKTAKQLGVEVPERLQQIADEVIE